MIPVLFLPGYLCTGELFGYQAARLPSGFRPLVRELPPRRTLEAIAEELWSGTPAGPAVLCGLSLGGMVAMEMVRQSPDRVAGLALLDTNARSENPEVTRARDGLVVLAGDIGIGVMAREKLTDRLVHPDRAGEDGCRELVFRMAEDSGRERLEAHARALADRIDYSPVLAEVSCPALILYGRQDVLCPADRQEHLMSLMPDADTVALERCGHLSSVERPEAVSEALNAWLKTVSDPPGEA